MNDYFNLTTVVTRLTAAKASAINAMAAAITAAFDKIPAQTALATDRVTYAADTGTANAKQMSLPLVTSYLEGLTVRFKVAVTNTGPATLQVNTLGARAIRRPGGTDINPGDLTAGSIHEVSFNGTEFELLTAVLSDVQEAEEAAGSAAASAIAAAASASNAAVSAGAAAGSAAAAASAVTSAIGSTVQAQNDNLQGLSDLDFSSNQVPIKQSGGWEKFTITNWARTLLLSFDVAAARTVLGLGSVATDSIVPVSKGGTGGTSQATARTGIGAQAELGFTPVQQGGGTSMGANKIHVGWDSGAGAIRAQVDATPQGFLTVGAVSGTVMGEVAGTGAGSVGTYVFAYANATVPLGSTLAGSSLFPTSAGSQFTLGGGAGTVNAALGGGLPGAWRCMGQLSPPTTAGGAATIGFATLWLRIS